MTIIGKLTAEDNDFALDQQIAYKVSLVGVDLERADLSGRRLRGANFTNSNLRAADMSFGDFRDCTFINCDFSRANLHGANFSKADVSGSDFSMAYMKGVNFHNTIAQSCIFKQVLAKNALFIGTDLRKSDFHHAELLGARFNDALLHRVRNMHTAQFYWWMNPWGGPQSYEPHPGWLRIDQSILGNISIQENAARTLAKTSEERLRTFNTEQWWDEDS